MKGWGDTGGKGAVFDILRRANGAEAGNVQLAGTLRHIFSAGTDDIWLAQNLQRYGVEASWPIHLRVEREMKGWADTGGKGVVFDILRTANGAEAGNANLTNSINTVFAAGTDDRWLARNLQQHGPEANWMILTRAQVRQAIASNQTLGYNAASIRFIQRLIGAHPWGTWGMQTVERIAVWQRGNGIAATGRIDVATRERMVMAIAAAGRQDDAIQLIIDIHNLPTANLARISYDPTLTFVGLASGRIAAGAPQTVRMGPATFANNYAYAARAIRHELRHVQQRSGAVPIRNQNVREFLAYSEESLDTTMPPLWAAERVANARIAIRYYNRLSPLEQVPQRPTFLRLQRLIANGGVGNP